MDRLARSLSELYRIITALTGRGVTVEFVRESTSYTPTGNDAGGDLMLAVIAAFAEFENAHNRERQAEGIALAKAAGKYKGRVPKLTAEQLDNARQQVAHGVPKARIARELGIDRSTLYRALG